MAAAWMAATVMAVLQGTSWVGPDHAPLKISFEDGNASGTLSCNSFRTNYQETEDTLGFGLIATTRMGCAPDRMKQERLVLGFLKGTASYIVDGDQLMLKDAAGNVLLTLNRSSM